MDFFGGAWFFKSFSKDQIGLSHFSAQQFCVQRHNAGAEEGQRENLCELGPLVDALEEPKKIRKFWVF